jgi:hypothetical protein
MNGDMKNGAFEFGGGVTNDLEYLTGAPAESFETTARRYAALPFARQTASNRLKAFAKFMVAPVLPGYNLSRIERNWGAPAPSSPSYGVHDAQWRQEHRAMMAEPAISA